MPEAPTSTTGAVVDHDSGDSADGADGPTTEPGDKPGHTPSSLAGRC